MLRLHESGEGVPKTVDREGISLALYTILQVRDFGGTDWVPGGSQASSVYCIRDMDNK